MTTVREKVAWALAAALGLLVLAALAGVTEGGPLDPPGAPSSTNGVRLPGTPISGLPFTASQPGHYYVTKNLSGASGISITSSDVTLDLGGFTITGGGAAVGIEIDPTKTRTTIRNGTIRTWSIGIRQQLDEDIDTEIAIEDIHVANTGGIGMQLASHAHLRDCSVSGAGGQGITLNSGSNIIENCAVRGAVGAGMGVGFSTIVRGCEVTGVTSNPGTGTALFSGSESVFEDCRIHHNDVGSAVSIGASGIVSGLTIESNTIDFRALSLSQGVVVRDSVIRANSGGDGIGAGESVVIENTVVDGNSGIGIEVDARVTVRANTVTNNGGNGIVVGDGSLVEANAVADNGGEGIVTTSGSRIIDNAVRLNADDPAITNGAGIHITGAGNYVTGNVLSSNDIGIRSDTAPSVIVRNSARNHTVANYQTQATDLTGVLITTANEVANSVQHYNDAP